MAVNNLVFDVNETLLDLHPLDALFAELFGDADTRRQWFAGMLHWSTVTTLTGRYEDFSALAGYCLDALAARHGIALSESQRRRVFDAIATLPPHADVVESLERLRDAGFTLVALTNSAQATVDAQFAHAGLTGYFVHVLSVDAARCFKPHPNAYALVPGTLGCAHADLRLIAAHDWDVTGAMRAGYYGAFVARDGGVINAAGETPDIVGHDLNEVTDRLIENARKGD